MLISTQPEALKNLKKPINFETMMRHHLNEVISRRGGFVHHQIKILDSHCFIMRPLNLKYAPFSEKANTLFHPAESQHFESKMLAFFFLRDIKRKTTLTL